MIRDIYSHSNYPILTYIQFPCVRSFSLTMHGFYSFKKV